MASNLSSKFLSVAEQAQFDMDLLAALVAMPGFQFEQFCPNRVIGHALTRIRVGWRLIGIMDHGVADSLNISLVTTIGVGSLVLATPTIGHGYHVYLADFGMYGLETRDWFRPTITVNVPRWFVLSQLVRLVHGLTAEEATASQPDATT